LSPCLFIPRYPRHASEQPADRAIHAATTDFFGEPLPLTSRPDIGADEIR
jgi:hypothetical protein